MSFKYTTYKGFMNYCLGICKNKQYEYNEEEIKFFALFENIIKLLDYLVEKNAIEIEDDIYRCIIQLFSEDPEKAFFNIEYMVNKLIKVNNNEISFYYFHTSLKTMLNIQTQFTKYFIDNYDKECFYYPEKVRVYKILSDSTQVFGLTEQDEKEMGHYGVYFIYDENNEIAYIGKSLTNTIKRSIESVKERQLRNFSKIEYRYPKTKSDVGIYEAYYIAKYKPKKNNDLVFEEVAKHRSSTKSKAKKHSKKIKYLDKLKIFKYSETNYNIYYDSSTNYSNNNNYKYKKYAIKATRSHSKKKKNINTFNLNYKSFEEDFKINENNINSKYKRLKPQISVRITLSKKNNVNIVGLLRYFKVNYFCSENLRNDYDIDSEDTSEFYNAKF